MIVVVVHSIKDGIKTYAKNMKPTIIKHIMEISVRNEDRI